MGSGTINTNLNSSAFIAVMTSTMKVSSIKIYAISNTTGEYTYAVSCGTRDTTTRIYGAFSTSHYQYTFRSGGSVNSNGISILGLTPYTISGTTLLGYEFPPGEFGYYGYFSLISNGDRQIMLNLRNPISKTDDVFVLGRAGYNTYHTKMQIPKGRSMWSGYFFQNRSDPSKFQNFTFS